MAYPRNPQIKTNVAEQLAMKTVGTTKMRAKPMIKKVNASAARRPRSRQVERETSRVVVAKARKRTSGSPAIPAWTARKDCRGIR